MVIYHFGANPLIHQQRLCNLELTLHGPSQKKILYFEWSPPWHLFAIVSDISSGNIYICVCGIIIWHSILAFYPAFYLTFYSGILSGIYSDILSGILCRIYTDIFLWHSIWYFFCHMFWHTFWHAIWHSIWHSSLTFYLASILTLFSGILSGISSEILCGWGPAEILCGGGDHSDPEVAVRVRRGTLRSTLSSSGGGRGRKEGGRRKAGWLT